MTIAYSNTIGTGIKLLDPGSLDWATVLILVPDPAELQM